MSKHFTPFDLAYVASTFVCTLLGFVAGRLSVEEPPPRIVAVPERVYVAPVEHEIPPPPPVEVRAYQPPTDEPPLKGLNDAMEPISPRLPPVVIPMGSAPKPVASAPVRPATPAPDVVVLEELPDNPYLKR